MNRTCAFWMFCLVLLNPAVTSADWRPVTQQQLVEQSQLIVTGTLLGRTALHTANSIDPSSIGILQVDEVLHGSTAQWVLLFLSAGGPRLSNEIFFTDGQRGLWYLTLGNDGFYRADRPDRFVPIEQASKHLKQLRR